MANGAVIFVGILMILVGIGMISQVTIPSISYNAENASEGINDAIDELEKENGDVGSAVVSTAWSVFMIYIVGWVGSIAFGVLTFFGIVITIMGFTKKSETSEKQ